jgi:hypothetical protein
MAPFYQPPSDFAAEAGGGIMAHRSGKWTQEEEDYAKRIITYFRSGRMNLPVRALLFSNTPRHAATLVASCLSGLPTVQDGTTLRSLLAEMLLCEPMRITKKFSGLSPDAPIGKFDERARVNRAAYF